MASVRGEKQEESGLAGKEIRVQRQLTLSHRSCDEIVTIFDKLCSSTKVRFYLRRQKDDPQCKPHLKTLPIQCTDPEGGLRKGYTYKSKCLIFEIRFTQTATHSTDRSTITEQLAIAI